jgi:hypothetical protein
VNLINVRLYVWSGNSRWEIARLAKNSNNYVRNLVGKQSDLRERARNISVKFTSHKRTTGEQAVCAHLAPLWLDENFGVSFMIQDESWPAHFYLGYATAIFRSGFSRVVTLKINSRYDTRAKNTWSVAERSNNKVSHCDVDRHYTERRYVYTAVKLNTDNRIVVMRTTSQKEPFDY